MGAPCKHANARTHRRTDAHRYARECMVMHRMHECVCACVRVYVCASCVRMCEHSCIQPHAHASPPHPPHAPAQPAQLLLRPPFHRCVVLPCPRCPAAHLGAGSWETHARTHAVALAGIVCSCTIRCIMSACVPMPAGPQGSSCAIAAASGALPFTPNQMPLNLRTDAREPCKLHAQVSNK